MCDLADADCGASTGLHLVTGVGHCQNPGVQDLQKIHLHVRIPTINGYKVHLAPGPLWLSCDYEF